jgi:phosphoserine aminotransferase
VVTFYPGPSKVYPQVAQYMQNAFDEGVLSLNHRSAGFMQLLQKTLQLLHQKLDIPSEYSIYLVSSATEAWEVVAQSLTAQHSMHFYNGSFGKKWFHYTANIVPNASATWFDPQHTLTHHLFERETAIAQHNLTHLAAAEVVCLTHNETSNGTQLTLTDVQKIRQNTDAIVALDVTSSLGGVALPWAQGDVWLASVQKCLGLPAGLGLMVCSPKALAKARLLNDHLRYNSLLAIDDNFTKFQTHYTPNVLGVYLLMKIMNQVADIQTIDSKTKARAQDWYKFINTQTPWQSLIQNTDTRANTVIAVAGEPVAIEALKKRATQHQITIGNGYGEWKSHSFRIANFPAIEDWEIEKLKRILS